MTVKNCHLFVSFVYKLSPLQYFSSLRFFDHLLPRTWDFTGGRYDGADLRRLCRTLRVDAFRTRDLHCNSYVENEQEDKEDEEVCRFCLKADGGAALVELFPGGGGSVADDAGAGEAGGRDGFVGFVQHWQREWGRG
ncbi:uncharacterized protein LOC119766783 [Culex quinquefasciatus]|nr:uncharacterized protein LOC119766783 [Culex quinquefasciatus]